MERSLSILAALALMLAACGDAGSGDDDSSGDGGGLGDGGGDDDDDDDEFGGDGGDPAEHCKKVDLVFSVDNSSSMSEEKAALANDVFPAFATALLAVGGGLEDYRVGVMDACPTPANYHDYGVSGDCNLASGEVWMSSGDPDLTTEFACVGNVDSSLSTCSGDNDDEQPASAAAASMEEPAASGANLGFLRDDALLVVVAITDEDEQPTPGPTDAQSVYDRLVAIKGDVKRMVFLGIGGGPGGCPDGGSYGTADEATTTIALTNLFIAEERGVFWNLCVGQLEDGLTEAMEVIEQACDDFVPIP